MYLSAMSSPDLVLGILTFLAAMGIIVGTGVVLTHFERRR